MQSLFRRSMPFAIIVTVAQVTQKNVCRNARGSEFAYNSAALLLAAGALYFLLVFALLSEALSWRTCASSDGRVRVHPQRKAGPQPYFRTSPWGGISPWRRPSSGSSCDLSPVNRQLPCLSPRNPLQRFRKKGGPTSTPRSTMSSGCRPPPTSIWATADRTSEARGTDRALQSRSGRLRNEERRCDEEAGIKRARERAESGLSVGLAQGGNSPEQNGEPFRGRKLDRKRGTEGHTGMCRSRCSFPCSLSRTGKGQAPRGALDRRGQDLALWGHQHCVSEPKVLFVERATLRRSRHELPFVSSTVAYSLVTKRGSRFLGDWGRRRDQTAGLFRRCRGPPGLGLTGGVCSPGGWSGGETERSRSVHNGLRLLRAPCFRDDPPAVARGSAGRICRTGNAEDPRLGGSRNRNSCSTRMMMMMNAALPGTAFEKRVLQCASNPIETMPVRATQEDFLPAGNNGGLSCFTKALLVDESTLPGVGLPSSSV